MASTPDRSLSPLGSYAKTTRRLKTDMKILLSEGIHGLICADADLRCKVGDVGFKMPGSKTYYCVPLKYLEIERPKR